MGREGACATSTEDHTEAPADARGQVTERERSIAMSLYQRGKSWYYDFQYRGERYAGCIGPVSKTIAKEILAKKKAAAIEGRYELPSKKPSPRLDDFVKENFPYTQANRRPPSVIRHETSWHAIQPVLGGKRLDEISPFDLERYRGQRTQMESSDVTIN